MVNENLSLLLLEHHHPVGFQVVHVNPSAELDDVGVLLAHEPSNVAEEEATLRVVRISVCIRVAVMQTVVATPDEHRILQINPYLEPE